MNFETFIKYPVIFLIAFVLTYLLVPAVRYFGRKVGMLDVPRDRHGHQSTVPRCGGVAVLLGFHGACALVFLLPWMPFRGDLTMQHWISMLIISSSLVVLGLLDDRIELWSVAKLSGQLTIALAAYYFGFRAGRLIGFELPAVLDMILTVGWFVGIMNAFNLIDGIDGLATGLAIVATVGLAGDLMLQHSPGDVLILLALLGTCLAFLRYNFYPATIFLGDSGSMFLGFILAAVALGTGQKGTAVVSMTVPLLAFGIPLFDTLLAVWRRAVRGLPAYADASSSVTTGKPRHGIMDGDREHLHHRLLKKGRSQGTVAIVLYVAGFVIVAAGLLSRLYEDRSTGIYLIAFLVFAYVVMRHLATIELWDSGVVLVKGIRRPPRKVLAAIFYPAMDILLLTLTFTGALYLTTSHVLQQLKWAALDGVPVWVSIPFLALFVTGCYKRVWSRARLLDYVIVGGATVAGVLTATAVVLILGAKSQYNLSLVSAIFGAVAPISLIFVRALPRIVFEYMALTRRQAVEDRNKNRQVLLYGAGFNCTLFLRALSFNPVVERDGYNIVGVVDDDTNLHKRFVYGYKVLGGISDVGKIVKDKKIDEIIVTTNKLRTESRRKIRSITAELNVPLFEWETGVLPASAISMNCAAGSTFESSKNYGEMYGQLLQQRVETSRNPRTNAARLPSRELVPVPFRNQTFKENVERELGRSRRHGHVCTLAVFTVARNNVPWALETLNSMLRLDDGVGIVHDAANDGAYLPETDCDEVFIGALLPETGEQGARIIVKRIVEKLDTCCREHGWVIFPEQGSDYSSLVSAALGQRKRVMEEKQPTFVLSPLEKPAASTA